MNQPLRRAHSRRAGSSKDLLVKVPQMTVFFWVVKILSTGMGEATSDWLVHRFSPVAAGFVGLVLIVAALYIQLLRVDRYNAWAYWFAVVAVAVFGTMAADGLHIELKVPYIDSTIFYAVALAVIFYVWHRSEGTLSIHSIYTPRREVFYWLTVLATFAMGTALGDLTATTYHLGYFESGVVFTAAFAVPALAFWLMRLNDVLAFWTAYVLTRPLGASYADWLGVPLKLHGLNWGRGNVALVSGLVILAFVAYLGISRRDTPDQVSA